MKKNTHMKNTAHVQQSVKKKAGTTDHYAPELTTVMINHFLSDKEAHYGES